MSIDPPSLGSSPAVADPVPGASPSDAGLAPARPRRRLAMGATAALVGQLATVAGGVVTSIFVAQMFGAKGTGTFALVGNLSAAVVLLAALGLPTGITFLVSRGAWPAWAAFRQSLAAAIPLGLAGTACGLAFYALTADSILEGITVPEMLAVLGTVPLVLAWQFCGAIALGKDLYERYASFQISRAALLAVAVVCLGIPFGLPGAIYGLAAAQAISALVAGESLIRLRRRRPESLTGAADAGPTPRALRTALRFGRRAWSADVLQFLNYRLDLFILAAYVSRADVGRYAIAVALTMLAWLLPSAIGQVLLPRTASLDSASAAGTVSREAADESVARVIRHTVILQVPTAVVAVAVLFLVIPLVYGSEFHQSIALGLLLLPGVLVASVAKVVSPVITGRGFPIYSVYNVLITVPVTVVLYLVLIPPLGATGAALASTASYTLTTVLALYFYRRATGNSVRAALVPTIADVREYPHTVSQLVSLGRARLQARARPRHT